LARRQPDALIELGRVAGTYGVRGWIRVIPHSGSPDCLIECATWLIDGKPHVVEATRTHSGALLAKLAAVENPEAARKLKGRAVSVPRDALPEAGDGKIYWADLVGLQVVNEAGVLLGQVKSMFSHGAHDVMELSGERVRLLPWVDAVVKRVDLDGGRIDVEWGADW